ncbi:GATA transcription factor 16-like [Camellia sinensis]|uniref:GATA-type domain-containing protein n=1 Tax=Camellia sinensis var. sinensis TaxID=542762 RepID=A0A4S4DLN3_CAMSN|nr:GATA transcription factor 16-like [Camellia sinensis]THG03870.1 hypothetical protein TEA_000584 [Camellia sinensis var. sinensis]
MVDLSDKGSESEDMSSKTLDRVKTCADCGTTKTPLWRGGPAGPKSLCNACGIRSRKKRGALLGLNKASTEDKKSKRTSSGNSSSDSGSSGSGSSSSSGNNGKLGDSLRRKLLALGREVVVQRSAATAEKRRRKLGEEEQAAVLLMALSCGSVFA